MVNKVVQASVFMFDARYQLSTPLSMSFPFMQACGLLAELLVALMMKSTLHLACSNYFIVSLNHITQHNSPICDEYQT